MVTRMSGLGVGTASDSSETPSTSKSSDAGPIDLASRVRQTGLVSKVALHLDQAWSHSKTSPEGSIDVIDVFSGCGGMSAGFKCVNGVVPAFRIAQGVDIDPIANQSFFANLGVVPSLADVSELAQSDRLVDYVRLNCRPGAPLVLIGCAPCQGFSSHRNAAGLADPRNNLFSDFISIAARIRADAVVVENVPEILTARYWPLVKDARERLEALGYFVNISIHNMAEFGVPQERFRALLVAMRKPFSRLTGCVSRGEFKTVRDALGDLPEVSAGERSAEDDLHYSARHNPSTLAIIRAVPKNGGNRPAGIGPESLRRARERQGKAAFEDVYGRLWWDRPAITVTAYARNPASGRFIHPDQDRGLTIREAALLQGFPRDYRFAGTLDQRFRQIGNAVAPPFSAAVAAHILPALQGHEIAVGEWTPGITAPSGASFSRIIPSLKAGSRKVLGE